jgi:hypothetical protein
MAHIHQFDIHHTFLAAVLEMGELVPAVLEMGELEQDLALNLRSTRGWCQSWLGSNHLQCPVQNKLGLQSMLHCDHSSQGRCHSCLDNRSRSIPQPRILDVWHRCLMGSGALEQEV